MTFVDIDRPQLLQAFFIESGELLVGMEQALLTLEKNPDELEPLKPAFRAAHTIKGNAWFLELGAITEFAHVAEDLLDCLRARKLDVNPQLITLLLRAVDALREMLSDAAADDAGELRPAHRLLMEELVALVPEAERNAAPVVPSQIVSGDTPDEAGFGAGGASPQPAIESSSAPAVSPDPGGRARPEDRARTLRVEVSKLDRILSLVGEITISRGRLSRTLEGGERFSKAEILGTHREADQLYVELQEQVMRVRMVALGPLFRQYNRAVRDLGELTGREARLVLSGEDVEVDMSVLEHLKDPLTHLIRNAMHHGIEAPDVRRALGKDPQGEIHIGAHHDAGYIVIEISDDGAGLDREKLRAQAQATGIHQRPHELGDSELLALIFEPGFTTADEVSEISGRGVGMDVVRRQIQELRGQVRVDSEPGRGTRITIRLPLTLAIIEGLSVGVAEEAYILPLDYVVECVELPDEERRRDDGFGVLTLRDRPLPFLYLRTFFGLPEAGQDRESVVVLQHEGHQIGLAVDFLIGETQAVIKPLAKMFQHLPALLGTTIMDNGRIAFILDVPSLVRRTVIEQQIVAVDQHRREAAETTPRRGTQP